MLLIKEKDEGKKHEKSCPKSDFDYWDMLEKLIQGKGRKLKVKCWEKGVVYCEIGVDLRRFY